ncbi:unnamed protein product [Closterium sp. Naga37s-1]|nr:unnamed protein product [Closterium sp. Naga37s-1]
MERSVASKQRQSAKQQKPSEPAVQQSPPAPLFSGPNLQKNLAAVNLSRTYLAIIAGVVAGILARRSDHKSDHGSLHPLSFPQISFPSFSPSPPPSFPALPLFSLFPFPLPRRHDFHMLVLCSGEGASKAKVKADYGGRVRTFPHVEGNFAVHVFIPVTIPASLQPLLQSHLRTAISALPALAPVDPDSLKAAVAGVGGGGAAIADCGFGATVTGAGGGATTAAAMHALVTGEVHMTAARTPLDKSAFTTNKMTQSLHFPLSSSACHFPLHGTSFHLHLDKWTAFVNDDKTRCFSLSITCYSLPPLPLHGSSFHLHLDKWTAFVNDEKTRSFLALEAAREGLPEFASLVHCIDQAYAVHGLPPYYDNPRPHVSLLWVAGNHLDQLLSIAHSLQMSCGGLPLCIRVNVGKVVCRVGQKVHTVWEDNRRAML